MTTSELLANHRSNKKQWERIRGQVLQSQKDLYYYRVAQSLVQSLAQTIQQNVHQRISGVVSQCLSLIFDDPYEFKIEYTRTRGTTHAKFLFVRNGEEFDPLGECGGGVIDVACLGLRIASLVLCDPKPRPILFLDEPFSHLDKETPERMVGLLQRLSEQFGIQIIQITHSERLVSGKEIRL